MIFKSTFLAFIFVSSPLLAETHEGSGALEVVYEPKVCIIDPCPQFKVTGINGDVAAEGIGADILNVELKKFPAGRSILVMGTWTREDRYLQVTAKEWLLNIREKIPQTEEKAPQSGK